MTVSPSRVREWPIHEELGRGGMGVVYRATHRFHPGEFAIKVIKPELSANAQARSRFLQEATVAADLKHPNIVRYELPFEDGGRLYLPMERMRGHTLSHALQSRPGPWPWTEAIARAHPPTCTAWAWCCSGCSRAACPWSSPST